MAEAIGWPASWTLNTLDRRNHRPGPPARDPSTSTGPARGTQNQAIGRSRGALTTKIVALMDALGNPARFVLDSLMDIYAACSVIHPVHRMGNATPVSQELNPLRSARIPLKPVRVVGNASVADEIESSAEQCRAALATGPLASVVQLPLAPQTPQACFDLVLGVPYDARCMEVLRRLKRDVSEHGHSAPFAVERFMTVQAYLVALPRLMHMPVPDSIKRQFCITCRDIASTPQRPDERLALDSAAFAELAQIVTLRRLHAGELSFDVMRMPLAWLLKAHPFDLAGFLRELCFGMRGVGPVVMPHVNYWRSNQMFLRKREHDRAIWRIAQFVNDEPAIKGVAYSSWLFAVETGEESPHLGWLREFFAVENARIIDAGPALTDAGFLVGNERRRQLYASGVFRPREAIVLWSRADMLAWAHRHPELADGVGDRAVRLAPEGDVGARAQTPARRWRSGRCTLIDCRRLLYYRPRPYIALVLALPALLGASVAGAIWSAAVMVPVFVVLVACLWVFQYLFLQ